VRVGSVRLLRRFPLRSAQGEHPASAELTPAGLAGDRRWSVVGADGEVLGAKRLPALAGLRARVSGDALSVLVDGRWVSGSALQAALRDLAGAPVTVQDSSRDPARGPDPGATSPGPHREGAAVHLVSEGAAAAPDAEPGCDPGERANAVLALDPAVAAAGAERGWAGRRLRVGEAELVLTRTPRRCLGVYAEVVVPGPVRVGDDVVLLDEPGPENPGGAAGSAG
jgi:uncharacterized protein